MNIARTSRVPSVVAVSLLVLTAFGCNDKHPKPVPLPPPTIKVAQPIDRPVTGYQIFTARTQAVQSVEIKARVTGFLTQIRFPDGGIVWAENQPYVFAAGLAGLMSDPFGTTPLTGAAMLCQANGLSDVLFEIDNRPYKATLDQAKATLELNKASLVKAQAEYDIGLAVQKQDKGAISTQEITKRLGNRDEAKASVDQAAASLANAQLNFDWCTVKSPITGRANTHFVDVGNLVTQNMTTLTNIVSLTPMWAYFYVDQNTMLKIQKMVREGQAENARNQSVPIEMGLANDTVFPFKGTIDFVSNQLDPNTGSIRVRAVFPNEDLKLASGMFGRIKAPIGKEHPALLVAESAIGTDQSKNYILVVNDKDEVEYRAVQTGQQYGDLREVFRYMTYTEPGPDGADIQKKVEVLKPADRVIVDGLQRVRAGLAVKPELVNMLTFASETGPAKAPTKIKK